jgi:hypothetical protein
MKTNSVKIFLSGLNKKLFDTTPFSDSNFLGTKGFFDVKPLSSFSFPELSKLLTILLRVSHFSISFLIISLFSFSLFMSFVCFLINLIIRY